MWTRKQLKEKGKQSFKRNYWKSVLIALLLALFAGGYSSSFSSGMTSGLQTGVEDSVTYTAGSDAELEEALAEAEEELDPDIMGAERIFLYAVMAIVVVVAVILAFAVFAVLNVFVWNPLQVGLRRFFAYNLSEPAKVKEIGYGFDHNYKNIVKTMFFKDLYTILWTLLFIIPGIVKSYEYRMIPYLLSENPQMTKEEAFARSRQMMKGQKGKAFILDLSFIGWRFLDVMTLGILGIFYVNPYYYGTHAALYDVLKGQTLELGQQTEFIPQ